MGINWQKDVSEGQAGQKYLREDDDLFDGFGIHSEELRTKCLSWSQGGRRPCKGQEVPSPSQQELQGCLAPPKGDLVHRSQVTASPTSAALVQAAH